MATPVYGGGTNADFNNLSTGTISSPSVSGSDTIGIVMLFGQTDTTGYTATWNGVACTSMGGTTNGSERMEAFYIINPPAGVSNVVGSRTGSSNDFRVFSAYYTGARQNSQPDVVTTVGPTTSGTATGTATVVTQDSILMMWIRGDAGLSYTAGANTTLRQNVSSIQHADSGATVLAPGSQSISMTSSSQMWHGVVWAIAPSSPSTSVAFDGKATSTSSGTPSSITYAHTCGTGANRVLLVGVLLVDSNARTISSVTYNGVAMTAIYAYSPSTNRYTAMYYLLAPSTGTNNVVVTLSGAVSNNIISSSLSYTGVKQTGFPDSNNKIENLSTNTITVSTTTVADNAWLAGFAWDNDNATSAGGTATVKRTSSSYGNGCIDGYDSNGAKTPAGSYSLIQTNGTVGAMSFMVASMAPAVVAPLPKSFTPPRQAINRASRY